MSKTNPSITRYIAANVWENGGDIRDVISIGKLVRKSDGPEHIELIMKTMLKYGMEKSEERQTPPSVVERHAIDTTLEGL